MNEPIDIVIPWVDGSDPKWRSEKEEWEKKYQCNQRANSPIRYQNWDNMHYWFRAVEKYMPWVNKIFFLTWGHVPEFLNICHPKLRIVKHTDYIPDDYLPTFNSNTIEMNCHRIKELSENFILFNDDLFPLQFINEGYYFRKNTVCDEAVESPIMPVDIGDISRWACCVKANDILILNKYFKKRKVQKDNFWKWFYPGYGRLLWRNISLHYWYHFAGFHDPHMAAALKKSTLKEIWNREGDALDVASRNKFRGEEDISWYLARYWQICSGAFWPRKTYGKSYLITCENFEDVAKEIEERKWRMVSLNEDCRAGEFDTVKDRINRALNTVLPEKCSFEK